MSCRVTVDGTDCPIAEPSPWSSSWYSHKLNSAALRYELSISLNGDLVAVNGHFAAGSNPDLLIFRKGLKYQLGTSEKVFGDKGYKDNKCVTPDLVPIHLKYYIAKLRARHETFNGRLKRFGVLKTPFRHSLEFHGTCFYAVAVITQISLLHEPLFD